MLNCSIAIQILPLGEKERIDIIDKVIYYIKSRHSSVQVTPFETVIEGNYDELMNTLKEVILIAGEEHNNIFANVKINYGSIMTINEKISKFN